MQSPPDVPPELLHSKSQQTMLIVVGSILLLVAVAAVVLTLTGTTIPYVGEAMASITAQGGISTARNVLVDGPVRRSYANAYLTQVRQNGSGSPPPTEGAPA